MKHSVIRHCRAAATSFVVAAAALAAAADPATNAVVKIPMEAFAKDADWKSFVPAGFTVSPSDAHAELGHAWMLSLKHVFVCYADDRYYYFGDAFFREPPRERVLRSNCKVDGRTGEIPDRPPFSRLQNAESTPPATNAPAADASHAETAEPEPHAESAEFAESESHAESAAPAAPASHAESAESAEIAKSVED